MSYEGYEQHICKNGHRFNCDSDLYWLKENHAGCPFCQAESAWYNSVDCTNGENSGIITEEEFQKILITPAKIEFCNLDHPHVLSEAVYRIPGNKELVRFFLTREGKYLPLSQYKQHWNISDK